MNLNGTEYYYIRNGQNDIIGLFNGSGTQVVTYTYDTWGKAVSMADTSGVGLGTKNPYRYRGYRFDAETGLYYLQSRYYNSVWGRFINADDYQEFYDGKQLLSKNLFAYCYNNPINSSDPAGYAPKNSEVPPQKAGYKEPKGGAKKGKAKNGKTGWVDSNGNVWVPDPSDHGGDHWDVQYPNGGYDNVYRDGKARRGKGGKGQFSPSTSINWGNVTAGIGLVLVGAAGTAILAADDATGIGVADDPLMVGTGGMFGRGLTMIFSW